jgi:hypothetical protein
VSDSLLAATPDEGEPRTQTDLDSDLTQVRVSNDGRYVHQDRPVIREGREIRHGGEALVNVEMAEARSIQVGETLPLAFWPGFSRTPFAHAAGNPHGGGERPWGGADGLLEPLARTEARVVGIAVFPDEVLVDRLYPRHRVVVMPDLAGRFDCTFGHPVPGDARPLEQIIESIVPVGCSMAYRNFSLRVHGGDRGVGAVVRSLEERFAAQNEQLPEALKAAGLGFQAFPTATADERQRVQGSLTPAVTALQVFGAGAAASSIVVFLLGSVRIVRRHHDVDGVWRDLGATPAQRTAGIALPLVGAAPPGSQGPWWWDGWLRHWVRWRVPGRSNLPVGSGSRLRPFSWCSADRG